LVHAETASVRVLPDTEDAMDGATALLTAATALVLSTIVLLIVWRSRYR
jgi:hypothetical protein